MPLVEPGSAAQGMPGQQSPLVVHAPPVATQVPPQMKAGPLLALFGTQGRPQQSTLVAQASPTLEPASLQSVPPFCIVQRGMPKRSCWQTMGFWFTLPAQQLFSALHEVVASLQIAPAGRQAFPLSHRPVLAPALLLHVPTPVTFCTPPKPQQSLPSRQVSPVGRQPLGGWQTVTPVGP